MAATSSLMVCAGVRYGFSWGSRVADLRKLQSDEARGREDSRCTIPFVWWSMYQRVTVKVRNCVRGADVELI